MKTILILATLFSALLVQAKETCGEITQPNPYKFCISKTPGSSNTDVLFYLHGGSGSGHEGKGIVDRLAKTWKRQKHEAPVVITVSFGPLWLLVGRNNSPNSGLLEIFIESIIPEMEKRAVGGPAKRRLLAGYSMGGFNSAQVLFNVPAGFFAKTAVICPAMIDLSPWASRSAIAQHAKDLGIPVQTLNNLVATVQHFVDDEVFYQTEVDPIALARTHLQGKTDLLVAVNEDDEVFRDGGEKFIKAAASAGVSIESQSWKGGHCKTDVAKLAKFLK